MPHFSGPGAALAVALAFVLAEGVGAADGAVEADGVGSAEAEGAAETEADGAAEGCAEGMADGCVTGGVASSFLSHAARPAKSTMDRGRTTTARRMRIIGTEGRAKPRRDEAS